MTFCPEMTEMTFLREMTEMSMSMKLNPVCTLSTVFSRLFRCQNGPGWFRVLQAAPGGARVLPEVPRGSQMSPDAPRRPQASPGVPRRLQALPRCFQVFEGEFRVLRPRTGQRDPGLFQPPRAQGEGGGDSLCCPGNCEEGPRALHP